MNKLFFSLSLLALVIGCTIDPMAITPTVTAQKPTTAAPAAPTDVKSQLRAAKDAAKKYNVHSWRSDVRDRSLAAIKAYESFASVTNCPNELGDLASAAIGAASDAHDTAVAKDFATRIFASGTTLNARFVAARYLALGYANAGDWAAADKIYDAFLATPKLNSRFYADAWNAKAQLKVLQNDRAGALATLDRGLAAIPEKETGRRKEVERYLREYKGAIHVAFYDPEAAYDLFVKAGCLDDALKLYDKGQLWDMAEAARLARQMLTEPKADFYNRLRGWTWLYNREPDFVKQHPALRPGDTLRNTNSVIGALAFKLTRAQIYALEGSISPIAYFGQRDEVIRTWNDYIALLDKVGGEPEFIPTESAVVSYASANDRKGAVAAARRGLKNAKLKSEERYELSLMAATLTLKGTPDEVANRLKAIEPKIAGDLDAKGRLKGYDRAGSAAMMTLDENLARGFAKYRAQVGPDQPKKTYVVKFSERPVASAADWANMPFKPEQSAFDRSYGGRGMAFMTTDVATGDRGEATQGGDGTVSLEVVADSWGLHILRTYHDKRAREFERGFLDAGSFEEYIAPGENQPYTCMLVYPKKDALAGGFETAYDGMGCRRIDFKNPTSFRSDVAFTDDAILVYTGIAWNNFPTLIPADGTVWDYESCFWGPKVCAWNGLKSIHGRSTWGRLLFKMPESARLKIMEDQICKAVVRYKAEKVSKHGHEGVLEHWSDPVVGDLAFYAARVKPLEAELDAVVARVNTNMTADDIRDIAENWLEKLVDIRFVIDRLRAEWLRDHLNNL